MNPRSFLNFFKTRSGKLLLFGVLFGGALLLLQSAREKGSTAEGSAPPRQAQAGSTNDKPQVIQTVQRDLAVFHPPPPKPDPAPPPQPVVNTNRPVHNEEVKSPKPPEPLPPISLFADSPQPEPKTLSPFYAPFGRLIPCETVITIDSSSIQTPMIGLITENIFHAGRLIIPAGTEVHGTAQTDRARDRIATGTAWTLVWQTGEEMSLQAIGLDREFANNNQEGWGITDGSAGLRGHLIKTDDLAEIKLFAATFLSGAAKALTEKEHTVFGTLETPTLNNAPFKGAEAVLSVYAQRIYDSIKRDGFYVRIPSGKQFYLYVLQTIDRAEARIGGGELPFNKTNTLWGATAADPQLFSSAPPPPSRPLPLAPPKTQPSFEP
jgi:hypothetical protein